ncbi:MAG: hypothetical protein RR223_01965 [Lachnospiraceae bacterium]
MNLKKRVIRVLAILAVFCISLECIQIRSYTPVPTVSRHSSTFHCPMDEFSPCAPRQGNVRALVFVVDFQDITFSNSNSNPNATLLNTDEIQELIFGPENSSAFEYPYESGAAYYSRSSFGKLRFSGDVLYYKTNNTRDFYDTAWQSENSSDGYELLIKEILTYYNSQLDYRDYDQNKDGAIDALYINVPLNNTLRDRDWWGNQSVWNETNPYSADETHVEKYVILDTQPLRNNKLYYNQVWIHETGHLLGLSDYYSVDNKPYETHEGFLGLGGFDMMDEMTGDHNIFSKIMCGWIPDSHIQKISPSTIGEGVTCILPTTENHGDTILIPTVNYDGTYCSSYYLIENIGRRKNNLTAVSEGGIRIWRINAQLTPDWWDSSKKMFAYDSNVTKTTTKLIEFVGGLYKNGTVITPNSCPAAEALPVQIKILSTIATGYKIRIAPLN